MQMQRRGEGKPDIPIRKNRWGGGGGIKKGNKRPGAPCITQWMRGGVSKVGVWGGEQGPTGFFPGVENQANRLEDQGELPEMGGRALNQVQGANCVLEKKKNSGPEEKPSPTANRRHRGKEKKKKGKRPRKTSFPGEKRRKNALRRGELGTIWEGKNEKRGEIEWGKKENESWQHAAFAKTE